MARAHPPEAVTRPPVAGGMVGDTLIGQKIAVIVETGRHRAKTERHILHLLKRFHGALHPGVRRLAVDLDAIDRRAAAPMRRLLDQPDPPALAASGQSRREAGDAAADDHQIGEGIGIFVAVLVAVLRHLAETGGFADDRLEDMLPGGARIHEGLVVEACGQEPREVVVDRPHVEVEARPVVLAFRDGAFEKLGRRHPLVRLEPPAGAETDEGVRLLRTGGHDTARAVILERPPDQHLIGAKQRRGERVALIALHPLAVEAEAHRLRAVDQTTALGKTRAHL